MTFLSGWRLVLLVAPALLLVAYVVVQRRRHAQVLRFTSVDLLDSVVPTRSGWQRHLPAGALLLSLVVLTFAFAQPAMAMRTAKQRATIMLTLDTSASMTATDVSPSRLEAMEEQATEFVKNVPKNVQIGLVTFNGSAALLVPPSTDTAPVLTALESLTVGGGTATADGITTALSAIAGVPKGTDGTPTPAVIVLMSDGTPTIAGGSVDRGSDADPVAAADSAAADAKSQSVPIDTIAFGTADGVVNVHGQEISVPSDPEAMAQIAAESGGQTFTAETASELGSIYDQIGRDVGFTTETKDLTPVFAGIALLIAVLAAAGALLWTQRLI
jgi:Ca-activated chloride channel family protein